MSDTQELFEVVWSYMTYLIPTIFIFSVLAFSDLLISLIMSIVNKAKKAINVRW